MEISHYKDYRNYLRDELERRMRKNPTYSLRAFAQHLEITPQMLSFVLNRKKNLSSGKAAQIVEKLNLDPDSAHFFLDLVALSKSKNNSSKKILEERLQARKQAPNYATIEASKFKVISDWYHYAILELTQTDGFQSDVAWIAKKLGIKPFEASQAIERLQALKLLRLSANGDINRTEVNLTASYKDPNAALRKLAKQYLEKSVIALEEQPMDTRDIANITMSIDPTRLPKAKEMIAKFRRELCAYLEQGNRTEVYSLTTSLIKLTKES